jgi:hypothetical protein
MSPDVLRRLEEEAQRLREEAYPGSLMEDIRPRLAERTGHGWGWRWLVPAAAMLALVAWLGHRLKDPQPRPSSAISQSTPPPSRPALAQLPTLSPFQTVRLPAPPPARLPTLSASGVPSLSAALRGGARELSHVRPPSPESLNKEE